MDIIAEINQWAERTPDKPAHISGERVITHGELRRQSDSLAAHLAGGGERGPVAILGQREPEMLVGFLGCVKAGRPYIPVDSTLPAQRVRQLVAAAALALDVEAIAGLIQTDRPAPDITLAPEDPWYIMFTSGSTGTPKGVVLTRLCLETFISWFLTEQKFIEEKEVFLNQVPFTFDLSVADIYGTLLTGGTMVSLTKEVAANPRDLFQTLSRCQSTFLLTTPSFARLCLGEPSFNSAMMPAMRKFLFCGETLPVETAAQMLRRFPAAEIWNTYGPTEATVAITSVKLDRGILDKYPALPIGKVMPGVNVWLIDEALRPVAGEGRGELVISGPNVTPGYLNAPEKNAVAFVYHEGARGYRTGDLGYFRDGYLFCEGRVDGQIKFNGHRIELGDIEAHLRALGGVMEAVVLPVSKDNAIQSLTAFIQLKERAGETDFQITQRLKTGLLERLPSYMLPRKFIYVGDYPLNVNGKIDRIQLATQLS